MDRPLLDLAWDYPVDDLGEPDGEAVLREINGTGPDGAALSAYTELKADGSTACGCWIYCGVYADEVNQARAAQAALGAGPGRGRVGLGLAGQPPDPLQPRVRRPRRHPVERAQEVRLVGRRAAASGSAHDVPDFIARPRAATTCRRRAPRARTRSAGRTRSSCRPTARRWLFAPLGRGRRPAADALRAAGVAGRQRALRAAEATRRAAALDAAPQPDQPVAERGLPVRLHHLPAHRAPHGRRR